MTSVIAETQDHPVHFRMDKGLERASPELREKLSRQLDRIESSSPSSKDVGKVLSNTFSMDGGSDDDETLHCGMQEDIDDAQTSDADSEPLEYAMLSVAPRLPSDEASHILDKVRRQSERQTRLKEELRRERSHSLRQLLPSENRPEPLEANFSRSSSGELETVRTVESRETNLEMKSDSSCQEKVEEAEDDDADQADPSAMEGDSTDELDDEQSTARSQKRAGAVGGIGNWNRRALLILLVGLFLVQVGPEAILQRLLPHYPGSGHYLNGSYRFGYASEDKDPQGHDVLEVETRLRRTKQFAVVRAEWLGNVAKLFVFCIAASAVAVLALALLCWRKIVGAIVAVVAGAVLFMLAVVFYETAGITLFRAD